MGRSHKFLQPVLGIAELLGYEIGTTELLTSESRVASILAWELGITELLGYALGTTELLSSEPPPAVPPLMSYRDLVRPLRRRQTRPMSTEQ